MRIIVGILGLFFLTHGAFADYVPGRTRASAEANLKVIAMSGIYKGIQSATMGEFTTDGIGITEYLLNLGEQSLFFRVEKIQDTDCGHIILARTAHDPTAHMKLETIESCKPPKDGGWILEVRTNHDGQESYLLLQGHPEYFPLSLGDKDSD